MLDCAPFKLNPNATKRIEIAFTPDLTLSRVERKLQVLTSLGPDSGGGEVIENGMVILNLLAILPAHLLHSCASVLARPSWEWAVHWAASCLSLMLLPCVLVVSFLEADRILRGALANYLKEDPVQPPLDLRLLSNISMQHNTAQVGSDNGIVSKHEKIATSDEKSPKTKKDEAFTPDWSLMNVKKCKDKDVQKALLKIPDWSAEEERRFKLDTESKDLLSFKRCEEPSNMDNAASTANTSTKKKNKKQNAQETQSDNCVTNDTLADAQLVQEKKCTVSAVTKSSPTSNRKGRAQSTQPSVKEETKLIDHEVQVDTGVINNSRVNKSDNKRNNKQTNSGGNNNSNHNNHVSLKKLDSTSTQKIVHLSEEETSSTTTESSTHDETTSCKVSSKLQ